MEKNKKKKALLVAAVILLALLSFTSLALWSHHSLGQRRLSAAALVKVLDYKEMARGYLNGDKLVTSNELPELGMVEPGEEIYSEPELAPEQLRAYREDKKEFADLEAAIDNFWSLNSKCKSDLCESFRQQGEVLKSAAYEMGLFYDWLALGSESSDEALREMANTQNELLRQLAEDSLALRQKAADFEQKYAKRELNDAEKDEMMLEYGEIFKFADELGARYAKLEFSEILKGYGGAEAVLEFFETAAKLKGEFE